MAPTTYHQVDTYGVMVLVRGLYQSTQLEKKENFGIARKW
jgi:hypothetical protein